VLAFARALAIKTYHSRQNSESPQSKTMTQETQNQQSVLQAPVAGPRRLYRSVTDRRISGLCGGIAEYFGVEALLIRILFLLSAIFGFGLLVYIAGWIIIPENPAGFTVAPKPPATSGRYLWGVFLVLLGLILLAEENGLDWFVPWRWHFYWPDWLSGGVILSVLLIGLGFFLVVRGLTHPPAATVSPPAADVSSSDHFAEGASTMSTKRLTRSVKERMIGGVCAGLAEYFNLDPSLVRILWVIMTFASGGFFGIIAYVIMMVIVPEQRLESNESTATAAR
jgi:phage shock protein PspC (stress-responsive transcriptional regulator)